MVVDATRSTCEEYVAANGELIEASLSMAVSQALAEQAADPIARIAEILCGTRVTSTEYASASKSKSESDPTLAVVNDVMSHAIDEQAADPVAREILQERRASGGAAMTREESSVTASPPDMPGWMGDIVATVKRSGGIRAGHARADDAPFGYRVSGAGTQEVNGLYTHSGEYQGMPLFTNGQWWLLRYTMPSGSTWWYIADKDGLDSDDGDMYRVRSASDCPPLDGWAKAKDGRLPAPRLLQVEDDTTGYGSDWTLAEWLRSLSLETVVASTLLAPLEAALGGPPSSHAELAFTRGLGGVEAGSAGAMGRLLAATPLLERLAECLQRGLRELVAAPAATAVELHSKFVAESQGFTLSYGGLDTFFGGLDSLIGQPSASMDEAILAEHTRASDSRVEFTAANYPTTTTSEVEYWFVNDPTAARLKAVGWAAWPSEATRSPLPLSRFERERRKVNARLSASREPPVLMIELMSGRLYTGPMVTASRPPLAPCLPGRSPRPCLHARASSPPRASKPPRASRGRSVLLRHPYPRPTVCSPDESCAAAPCRRWQFVKYNGVLRGLGNAVPFLEREMVRLCTDNRYVTTLHAINSLVVKVGKVTRADKVYRGISGALLPDEFWAANEHGVRGGVEAAFMSTTTNRAVALEYGAGNGVGLIFEIQQGMLSRGADLQWLSQYPAEAEILFAPLAGLEVQSTRIEGCTLIVEVRPSVNLQALTIEQVGSLHLRTAPVHIAGLRCSPLNRREPVGVTAPWLPPQPGPAAAHSPIARACACRSSPRCNARSSSSSTS